MNRIFTYLAVLTFCLRITSTHSKTFLEKVCYNALETEDPKCLHGGTLHATNASDYLNCASCDCKDGWRGIDCGLCTSNITCPKRAGHGAIACTSTSISPTNLETIIGKNLSCYCGGNDGTTRYICRQQPGTNWQISISKTNSEGMFNMKVIERGGIPSQDYQPTCYGHDPHKCPTKERYRYAASQVWQGTLLDCYWEKGRCISPLKGKDCIVYKCKDIDLQCPPSYVKKCPGWTPFKCGNPPGEDSPYWMHHCSPAALPMAGVGLGMTLACKRKPHNGRFQCYLAQKGAMFASIGMKCETGSCVYNDSINGTIPMHKKPGKDSFDWFDEHQAELLIGLMALCLIIVLIIAIVLIISDKRRSLTRAEEWVNDASNNISDNLTPLLQTRASQQDFMLSQSLVLHFQNIQYFVRIGRKKFRQVLKSVHGVAAPYAVTHEGRFGSMLAIMGPSGAGKTSLLDILSGYRQVGVDGLVHVNGVTLRAGDRYMRKIAGYVQQDDVLPGTSTVFEYLLFNAALRMPREVTRHEKEKRVFDVIQQLGLSKIAHSFIGDQFTRGISGGEKRRVSIACERIVGPKLVFLDEPTTGLDSTNASKVVDILSDMASSGVTIVMSIHQPRPDLFRTLDRAILLSSVGQVIYSGPSIEAENYFLKIGYSSPRKTIHVMDYMLDVVIKADQTIVDSLVHGFSISSIKENEDEFVASLALALQPAPASKFRSTFQQQVRCLSTRLLRNTSRHPLLIALNFVANLAVALGLGLLFHDTGRNTDGIQSRLGVLFFILMFLSTMSLSSLPVWREERLLFKRERGNGVYGASAYFLSVLLFDLIPLRVLPPMFFSVLSYWMIDLHSGCALCILWFTLIVVLTNVVASLTSMTIGAATPTNAVANALGSLFVVVFLLFAGYFLNKDEMPKWCKALSHLSYLNYGFAGLVINEFKDAPGEFRFTALIDDDDVDRKDKFESLRIPGDMIICEFGFDDKRFIFDVVMLCIIGGVCCLVTYGILLVSGRDLTPSLNISKLQTRSESDNENRLAPSSSTSSQITMETPLLEENAPIIPCHTKESTIEAQPLTLNWQDVTCVVSTSLLRGYRTILKNIHGVAGPSLSQLSPSKSQKPNSMFFAIMGPSGAGKTTLIDILAGRKRDIGVSGDIRINGESTTARLIRRLSGYVLQDNVLPGTPTVFEHIMFHARLRIPLPKSMNTKEQRWHLKEKVLNICQQLGLDRVMNNCIGDAYIRGLSGGERKRVSIACELLVDPGLLFLDEPTSGLDSTNATQVIDILSKTALSGVTVIMSIHQPRPTFFNLIDKIMMLSGDGQLVFSGDSQMAKRHFQYFGYEVDNETLDVFDFVLDLIIKLPTDNVQSIVSSFEESEAWIEDQQWINEIQKKPHMLEQGVSLSEAISSKSKYHSSHWTQIKVLSTRMGRNLYRHPLLLFVNFLSSLFVSLMLGSVYWDISMDTAGIQNRLGSLFFIITYLSLMSLSSLPLWHDDRLLFVRERASGAYGTTSYFVANVLFDIIPMRVFPPCFFGLFSYWMIGFHDSTAGVLQFVLIIILCNIAASTFSLAIGASIDSTSMANLVASLFILLANLLGGFFLSRKTLFSGLDKLVDIISKLSFVRYAYEALLLNEFQNREGFRITASYRCIRGDANKKAGYDISGNEILRTFGFPTSWSRYGVDIGALICFIVVHGIITFLLFKFRDRPGEPSIWSRIKHKFKKILTSLFYTPDMEDGYTQQLTFFDSQTLT
eukprot:g4799.t1